MKGWVYILECADGSYYTGSTKHLEYRLEQHQSGKGANHTKKRLPVKLVYVDEFDKHNMDAWKMEPTVPLSPYKRYWIFTACLYRIFSA